MPPVSDAPGTPSARNRRFDWWQALVRVLSSIEAVRDGRAMYMLLVAYAGAGTSMASAIRAYGEGSLPLAIRCSGTPINCTVRRPARASMLATSVAPVKSSAMTPSTGRWFKAQSPRAASILRDRRRT